MLRLITRQEADEASEDVRGMIYGGTDYTTKTWVETGALMITEVTARPGIRYFELTITDAVGEAEILELDRLERELGKSLAGCVVERERVHEPHDFFPGSHYFDLVTVYGG